MLSADQITAIAPDASSLKAGRDQGTPRKWESVGRDDAALWGLALGSGMTPYRTQVALADLASKCSCPSRKFPCKHALGLLFLATGQHPEMAVAERPAWVAEWLDGRAARSETSAARAGEMPAKPIDEKAAEKRRAKRDNRVGEGVALLQQSILDLTRDGLGSGEARRAATWENLAKRMIDCQAPGLAGQLRHIAEIVLRDPDVDAELPLELGRLHLLLHAISTAESADPATQAELRSLIGGKSTPGDEAGERVEDDWFVASREVTERDRLVTSSTWMLGVKSGRWARLLRFAPVQQTLVEPWPPGSTVRAALRFHAGLHPLRARPENEDVARFIEIPAHHGPGLPPLLDRFAAALAENPFLRALPFLVPLRPAGGGDFLADASGAALPWRASPDVRLRVEAISGGHPTPICGEWDGRFLRPLAIRDGDVWFSLTPKLA